MYPLISSSIFHRGIPSSAALLCLDQYLHQVGSKEDVWTGQMFDDFVIGGSQGVVTSTNTHMG